MVNSGLCLVDSPSFLKLLLISNTLSKPPTNNLFKYNSGAILRNKSLSKALCLVIKGLATAPPGIGCIIGVSTSIKSLSFNELLTDSTIFVLSIKTFLESSLLIKSRYLCLYLISISDKPLNLSGIGLIDLVISTTSLASMVSSSVLVLNSLPLTPAISPKSQVLKSS